MSDERPQPPGGEEPREPTPEERGFVRDTGAPWGATGCLYGAVGIFIVLLLLMLVMLVQRMILRAPGP